jgi:hypothetical protein
MPTYSVWMLGANDITVSGGGSLSGFTQGDGSHLLGKTITLNTLNVTETFILDNDANFDDNDNTQSLDGAQTINGVTYASGTRVEAEYRLVLQDPDGNLYTVLGYNVNNSNPAYATVEGLAFVGPPAGWPPAGVPLTVVQTAEGPGSFGQPPIPYDQLVVPCFTPGTRIRCPGGPRRIESLAPGDLVCVQGAGPQPLLALLRTHVDAALAPQLAPVTIRAHALGPGRPVRDLTVSPQHRILIRSARADLMFGSPAVLVAAVHLVNGATIRQAAPGPVTYLHLVFKDHHIVWAEGVETESFLPAAAMADAPPALRAEIATLFPGHAPAVPISPPLRGWEARALAGRGGA